MTIILIRPPREIVTSGNRCEWLREEQRFLRGWLNG